MLDRVQIILIKTQQKHILTLQYFNSDLARIKIESEPIKTILKKGILYEFDLNNDGINDLKIRYDGINPNDWTATIFMQEIISGEEIEQEVPMPDEQPLDYGLTLFILVLIAIILAVFFIIKNNSKKKKK